MSESNKMIPDVKVNNKENKEKMMDTLLFFIKNCYLKENRMCPSKICRLINQEYKNSNYKQTDRRTIQEFMELFYDRRDKFENLFNINIKMHPGGGTQKYYYFEKMNQVDKNQLIDLMLGIDESLADRTQIELAKDRIMSFLKEEEKEEIMQLFEERKKPKSKYSSFFEKALKTLKSVLDSRNSTVVMDVLQNGRKEKVEGYVYSIHKKEYEPYVKIMKCNGDLIDVPLFNIISEVETKRKNIYDYPEPIDETPIPISFYFIEPKYGPSALLRFKEIYHVDDWEKVEKFVVRTEELNNKTSIKAFYDEYEMEEYVKKTYGAKYIGKKKCFESKVIMKSFIRWFLNPNVYPYIRIVEPVDLVDNILGYVDQMKSCITKNHK